MNDMMAMGLMIGGEVPEVDPKNKERAVEYWMYGATAEELAKAWDKPVDVAKLKTCGNCEYFNNKAKTLKALDAEPTQGVCMKFKFLCSQEASCMAWDSCDMMPEEEDS